MRSLLILIFVILFFSSCHKSKPLFSYHPNPSATTSLEKSFYTPVEPVLSIGDKITMSVWGHEDLSIGSVNSIYSSGEETGKWLILDDEGKVNLPKIGRIKVAGLTTKEAGYLLEQRYSQILTNPIVNVRVLNHFITVLGEVNNPGRYSLGNEMVSLIEALGIAGGLSIYSKNDEIEVVRIINGQSVKLTVDLTDLTSLPHKNILLHPDDIIHVGVTKRKDNDRNLEKTTLIASIVTGVAVFISVITR